MLVTLRGIRDAGELGAARKRVVRDASDVVGDRVTSGFGSWILDDGGLALVEQDTIHTAIGGVERLHPYRTQTGAATERRFSDAGDAVGDRNAGELRGSQKRVVRNTGDSVGNRVASGLASRKLDEGGLALV